MLQGSSNLISIGATHAFCRDLIIICKNAILGGSSQIITILHRGGYAQFITILHRGGYVQFITYYIGRGGSAGTPKMYYVIYERPLIGPNWRRQSGYLYKIH